MEHPTQLETLVLQVAVKSANRFIERDKQRAALILQEMKRMLDSQVSETSRTPRKYEL